MTGVKSNIDEVVQKFSSFSEAAKSIDFSEALVVGVNAAMGEMKFRIFNLSRDIKNTSLGTYKPGNKKANQKFKTAAQKNFLVGTLAGFSPYMLKRLKFGRQVRIKDLELTGDLRRGIKVAKETQALVVCTITNDQLLKIANGQEQQLKTIIFALSDTERQTLISNTNAAIQQLISQKLLT